MKHILNEDGKLYRLLEMIMELGIMNFLFLLCSIPVFTIGPAYVALLGCADAFRKGEGSSTSGNFFKHFRAAFLPSLVLGIVTILVLALLAYNTLFTMTVFTGAARIVLLGVYFLLFLLVLAFVYYLARLIGQFRNFCTGYLKAALLGVVAHLPRGLGIAVATASPLILAFFPVGVILSLLPVLLFFWFSTMAVLCMKLAAPSMEQIGEFCKKLLGKRFPT